MAVTDITTTADVRAALGVSEKELRDEVLLAPMYITLLTEDVNALHPSMLTDFGALIGLDPKTEAQQRFTDLLSAYASYHIAKQCLGAVAMFAPVLINAANKSQIQRSTDPYAQLRVDVPAMLARYRALLQKAYAAVNPDAAVPAVVKRTYATGAPLGTDPITG